MNDENNGFGIYTNDVNLSISQFDFVFQFNENIGSQKRMHGTVTMSPQHAKALTNLLVDSLKKYENTFGELPFLDATAIQSLQEQGILKVEVGNE